MRGRGRRAPERRATSWRRRVGGAVLVALVPVLLVGAPAGAADATWWHPGARPISWQWELDHPLRLSSRSDMGTNATLPDGKAAPAPTVYDIDGFDNKASTVAALHRRGDKVICYIEVGAAERYRPDYHEFPVVALGRGVPGYPAERYLNIKNRVVGRIIRARIAMCAAKGFDAIEPDIDDSYTDHTGFKITEGQNIAYDRALAAYAHQKGLAWGQKNGDNDPRFSTTLERFSDFLLDEQCFQYVTCETVTSPYRRASKAVFEVEYKLRRSQFCVQADRDDFNSQRMNVALAGGRQPCR
jgi:hypothetical protein